MVGQYLPGGTETRGRGPEKQSWVKICFFKKLISGYKKTYAITLHIF